MIHLETLHRSPFRYIGLLRIYLDTPRHFDAYAARRPYDYICVIVHNPRTGVGEIKGLTTRRSGGSRTIIAEVADTLHRELGLTQIRYERAKKAAVTLYRHGQNCWRPFQLPTITHASASAPATEAKRSLTSL